MESHPEYPTLISLTDTLTELNLTYSALLCEKERYKELQYPLLAHISLKGQEDFIQVDSSLEFTNKQNYLLNSWDGVVVYIEPKSSINHKEHNDRFIIENKIKQLRLASIVIAISLTCFLSRFANSSLLFSILIFSILGATLCIFVIFRGIGRNDFFSDRLCASEGGGCNSVLKSRVSSWNEISLGDLGFIYFITISLFIALTGIFFTNFLIVINFLKIPIGLGLLIGCASLLYQWIVIKAWCRLCLLIDAVLCLQALVLFSFTSDNSIIISNNISMVFLFLFILTGLIWYWYKQMLIGVEDKKRTEIAEKRFKRDPELFVSLLEKQRRVNTTPWEDDIFFGSRAASIQLIVVCNPYCNPCSKTHKVVVDLINSFPTEIGITIRFSLKTDDPNEKQFIAVSHILSAWLMSNENAVDEWFEQMNLPDFLIKFPEKESGDILNRLLKLHEAWVKESGITHTPTIFINGWELPRQYKLSDLKLMLIQLSEYISISSDVANLAKGYN